MNGYLALAICVAIMAVVWLAIWTDTRRQQHQVKIVNSYRDPDDEDWWILEIQRGDGPVTRKKVLVWPKETVDHIREIQREKYGHEL